MNYRARLDVARQAAEAAAVCIDRHYRDFLHDPNGDGIGLEIKPDATPVTRADKEAETLIRKCIEATFPDDDIYGEEMGRSGVESEFLWLVDPLDGTRSFVRGYPFFSTQIALMHNAEIVLGVSQAPLFDECAWALAGEGAWLNGERLAVSKINAARDATLSTGNLRTAAGESRWQGLGTIVREVARTRGYGDFYHYHLLAAGKLDLVIESDVNILDIAALSLIVTEAGGRFTDLDGKNPGLGTTSVLAGNPAMWEYARALL